MGTTLMLRAVAVCGFTVIVASTLRTRATSESGIAFINVSVITARSDSHDVEIKKNQTVLVRDRRIIEVGPVSSVRIPPNVRRIDGRDRFLIPGLADMHVHIRSEDDFLGYLNYGVTTVFNLGGAASEAPDLLRYRRELEEQSRSGPQLFTSGPLLDGAPPIFPRFSVAAANAEDARLLVESQHRSGYDLIKVYNRLSPDAYRMAAETAKRLGIAIGGHIPERVSVEEALEAQDLVAHGSALMRAVTDSADTRVDATPTLRIAELAKQHRVTIIPNLIYPRLLLRLMEDSLAPFRDPEIAWLNPAISQVWRANPARLILRYNSNPAFTHEAVVQITRALDQAGVRLLIGTDAPAAVPGLYPGKSAWMEMEAMVSAGLPPGRVLFYATASAGDFVREHVDSTARFGRIEAGYRADLVLLEANPLEAMGNIQWQVGVMSGGRWHTTPELRALRVRH